MIALFILYSVGIGLIKNEKERSFRSNAPLQSVITAK